MKKVVLMLCGCMLFTSLSFAQQDSTGMNKRQSVKKHNSTTSPQKDTSKKDTSMKRSKKKGGKHNNMDSTATINR